MSSNREEPFSRILESIISPSHVDHGFVLRTDLIGLLSFWLLIFNYSCSLRFSETREYSIIDGRIVYLSLSLYLICSIQIKSHLFHLYKTHLQKIEFVFFFSKRNIKGNLFNTNTKEFLRHSTISEIFVSGSIQRRCSMEIYRQTVFVFERIFFQLAFCLTWCYGWKEQINLRTESAAKKPCILGLRKIEHWFTI